MTTILLPPAEAESDLANTLQQSGARVLGWPSLNIDGADDYFALDQAIENIFGYDWLILRNRWAAQFFLRRFQLNHEPAELDALKILTLGDPAMQTLAESQVHADVQLESSALNSVFSELCSYAGDLTGVNILVPSTGAGRESFEAQFAEGGARVDNITAYRTVADQKQLAQVLALLIGGGVDCIVFTSAETVGEFATAVDTKDLRRILPGVAVVCRDANTSATAEVFGLAEQTVFSDLTFTDLERLLERR